jgi:hypothetical protein
MIDETIYNQNDLVNGKCISCGEKSDEILVGDGRCVDCIEEQKFYEKTMNNNKMHDIFGEHNNFTL